MDEKDFAADSWSLAVDSSFLQQHKKEVMKQQDVIYGEPRPPRDFSALLGPGYWCPSASSHLSRSFPLTPLVSKTLPASHRLPLGTVGLQGSVFIPSC